MADCWSNFTEEDKPTVSLTMIVKDEEHIIRECLDSMAPYIDRYDISDTGSTDRTKEIIEEWGKENNIPGTVYDIPWQGFGKSRTESLRNADKGGADYAWVMDADDFIEGDFVFPKDFGLHHAYSLNIHRGDFNWWRNQIYQTNCGWEYIGVVHEYSDNAALREKGELTQDKIQGKYHIEARTMGARTLEYEDDMQAKYARDAEMLLDCLENPENPNYEPDNKRYMFYLAQSYFDSGNFEEAEKWYRRRAEAGGWDEEVWYSVFRVGLCITQQDERPWHEAQDVFLQAWNLRPSRAEPLFHLARLHRLNGNPAAAYLFAVTAARIPFPEGDILFITRDIYDWACLDEVASTAWYAGQKTDGLKSSMKLLEEKLFPKEHEERIVQNWRNYQNWFDEENRKHQEAQMQARAMAEREDALRQIARKEANERRQKASINRKRQLEKKNKKRSRARR